MDTTSVFAVFKIIAPEFADIEEETVLAWIELTEPLIDRRKFGNIYKQALALLTAHRMKMANVGSPGPDPLEEVGNIGVGNFMRVGSYTEGKTAIGFNHNIGQYLASDAELVLTEYGIQFLTLRRMRVYPIVLATESLGRG